MKSVSMKSEIIATDAKKCFAMIKMIKVNMKYFAKSGIITTTPDNLEVLPTIFVEKQTRSKEKF